MKAQEWLENFAAELGVDAPSQEEVDVLLELAGIAAHSSERIAAPIACWLAGCKGVRPAEARAIAERIG
jgi:Domain of unknown function (DUF6457)